jgi:tetratricopeptide (TPR) repeat protein
VSPKRSAAKDRPAGADEKVRADGAEEARARLGAAGRNDPCPCGSGKKYKKCHLVADQAAAAPPPAAPDAKELLAGAWRLFEQRRPTAAEREFRAALAADPKLEDARVGIGLARLSAGDTEGARTELGAVVTAGEASAAKLGEENVKDAFTRPEAQPYIRAAHALGCLAYDQERWSDAVADLGRVFRIDNGTVGSEARLIAAKALMKQGQPAEAAKVLEPAADGTAIPNRARLGLALARFAAGAAAEAREALDAALEANPHFAKALLGRIRRRVENVAAAQPGSVEEALVYAQAYGDVWTDDAKKFLEAAAEERIRKPVPAPEEPAETETSA